jgi:peptidoglycan/LPS O-acetylase OafA/YrhL
MWLAWVILAAEGRSAWVLQRLAVRLRPLGNMSYSLYVVHYPVIMLLAAWWSASHTSLPLGVELFTLGVAVSLALGAACWYLVERHFVRERRIAAIPSVREVAPSTS